MARFQIRKSYGIARCEHDLLIRSRPKPVTYTLPVKPRSLTACAAAPKYPTVVWRNNHIEIQGGFNSMQWLSRKLLSLSHHRKQFNQLPGWKFAEDFSFHQFQIFLVVEVGVALKIRKSPDVFPLALMASAASCTFISPIKLLLEGV